MNIRMSGLAIAVLALSATSAFADVDLTPEVKTKIEDMLKTDDKLAREVALLIKLVEQQPPA